MLGDWLQAVVGCPEAPNNRIASCKLLIQLLPMTRSNTSMSIYSWFLPSLRWSGHCSPWRGSIKHQWMIMSFWSSPQGALTNQSYMNTLYQYSVKLIIQHIDVWVWSAADHGSHAHVGQHSQGCQGYRVPFAFEAKSGRRSIYLCLIALGVFFSLISKYTPDSVRTHQIIVSISIDVKSNVAINLHSFKPVLNSHASTITTTIYHG